LSISTPKEIPPVDRNSDKNAAGSNSELISAIVDIKADKGPNSNFNPPVQLWLGVDNNNSDIRQSSVCIGYAREKEYLRCDLDGSPRVTSLAHQSCDSNQTDNKACTIVCGDTTHFTSFAVLLMGDTGFPNANSATDGWLWPVSIALLGTFLLAIPALIFTVEKTTKLKRWIYGYHSRTINGDETYLKIKQQRIAK